MPKNITIYHNPRCSKSRQTLALLEENGITPKVVQYLKTPLDAAQLRILIDQLGVSVRDAMRPGESAWAENNLDAADDDALINAIVENPILMQRPVVVANDRAAIGRPPEAVLELLT